MTKLVFKLEQKGLFKALGLHHALVVLLITAVGYFIHPYAGAYLTVLMTGWYLQHEWGPKIKPGAEFEYMDFLAPLAVSTEYLIAFL